MKDHYIILDSNCIIPNEIHTFCKTSVFYKVKRKNGIWLTKREWILRWHTFFITRWLTRNSIKYSRIFIDLVSIIPAHNSI